MPTTTALPWLQSSRSATEVKILRQASDSGLASTANTVRNDTGEVERDWIRRFATVNTPQAQAAMGELGGRDIRLTDVQFRLSNPLAVAAAISLDGKTIAQSDDWMLVVMARAQGKDGRSPFLIEATQGVVQFRLKASMRVSVTSSDGQQMSGDLKSTDGWVALDLGQMAGKGAMMIRVKRIESAAK
jgi:hypothetical protein